MTDLAAVLISGTVCMAVIAFERWALDADQCHHDWAERWVTMRNGQPVMPGNTGERLCVRCGLWQVQRNYEWIAPGSAADQSKAERRERGRSAWERRDTAVRPWAFERQEPDRD